MSMPFFNALPSLPPLPSFQFPWPPLSPWPSSLSLLPATTLFANLTQATLKHLLNYLCPFPPSPGDKGGADPGDQVEAVKAGQLHRKKEEVQALKLLLQERGQQVMGSL